jgi:peroxiredoxin
MTTTIGPAVGDHLVDFRLPDDSNALRTPETLAGEKGLLLVFVHGTWCASCVPTFYSLAKYAPVYQRDGVNVAIVTEDAPGTLATFKRSAPMPIDYALLSDSDETAHQDYKVGATRLWLLTDPDGVVRHKHIDPDGNHRLSHNDITAAINEHLIV